MVTETVDDLRHASITARVLMKNLTRMQRGALFAMVNLNKEQPKLYTPHDVKVEMTRLGFVTKGSAYAPKPTCEALCKLGLVSRRLSGGDLYAITAEGIECVKAA